MTWVNAAESLPYWYHCPLQISRLAFFKLPRSVPLRQEIPQERFQPVAVSPPEVRTAPLLVGKRLLAVSGIAFVVLLIAATHPSLIKAAWAKFEHTFQSKSAPLPASPAKMISSAPEVPTPGPFLTNHSLGGRAGAEPLG